MDTQVEGITISFTVEVCPDGNRDRRSGQSSVWNALYNAAQTKFYAKQEQINAQIAALQGKISNVDTLTLRREESDEIMKCALRWLLGG